MENWGLWSWSIQSSSSLPVLAPHTFPLFQCGSFWGATLQKYLLPCGLSRRCSPSGNIHLLHSGPPQAAKSLLQHLKHFLPSSFFDHDVPGLLITLFPSLLTATKCFPFFEIRFPRGTSSMAGAQLCHAWISWGHLELFMSVMAQPQPLLIDPVPQPLWLGPGHLHLAQLRVSRMSNVFCCQHEQLLVLSG